MVFGFVLMFGFALVTEPILVGKKQAAELLGICVRSLEYIIQQKKLVARKVGRRTLIPYRALQEFARRDTPTIEKSSGKEVSHGQ
jgi:excisionase family DNA binding protein